MNRKWMTAVCVVMAVAMIAPAAAQAPAFPSKPVRFILAHPPGSGLDAATRALAQEMSKDWGQPVVVENRPGASGMIGAEACARAGPDGHAFCVVDRGQLSFVPNFYKKIPFDPAKDLEPIGNMFDLVSAFVLHPSVPANSVKELMALARAKPGSLNFGSVGDGTPPHLIIEWIKKNQKLDMVHVPYKGAAPMVQSVIAGEIQFGYISAGTVIGPIRAGRLKVIAVSGDKRSPVFPGVPTLSETAGLAGVDDRIWFGLVGPAGIPRTVVAAIYGELVRIIDNNSFREQRLVSQGWEPALIPPQEFGRFLAADREVAGKIVRALGIKLE
ncbi:MAG: tripartite tricarboxylate transporter substrate binding protein [Betaproteobacteria bacterium]|nr:tripartite tricarboxylate transporter substrate binding protein [Betaproteobacteria bacterium]